MWRRAWGFHCGLTRNARSLGGTAVFSPKYQQVLGEEKGFLAGLSTLLEDMGGAEADKKLVHQLRQQLDELFLVVVVGEFNSGKSTLINALLGARLLADGVTPTTHKINIIKYGEKGKDFAMEDAEYIKQDLFVHRFDVPWLKEINVVDTPGTNAIFESHQILTEEFLPRSDLVLFVTSADRPFSASERTFLQKIRNWNRKFTMVVNKADLMESQEDLDKVLAFVKTNLEGFAGTNVPLFSVAARKALRGEKEVGFNSLREFILKTLSEQERALIKLRSPLGIASNLLHKYTEQTDERIATLANDAKALEKMDKAIDFWRQEVASEFALQQAGLMNILLELEVRAAAFLDETMVLTNLYQLLMKQSVLKEKFDKQVVGSFPLEVDRHLSAVVDWMVGRSSTEFQKLVKTLTTSMSVPAGEANSFTSNRADIAAALQGSASKSLTTLDRAKLSDELSQTIRSAAMSFTAIEIGAVGLASVFSAALVDITGILGVGAVAATGLAVLPYRKRQLKSRVHRLLGEMRAALSRDLQSHFDRHILQVVSQIKSASTPFAVYVKSEGATMQNNKRALVEASSTLASLTQKLEKT